MRWSVDRLRWLLLVAAVLLVAVVAGFIGYGRYVALKRWRTFVQHTGATITHETNGFTYSQSVKGKTLFTLHAAKALEHADGTWTLKDADLTLYSRNSERTDHIYGAEFVYDPKQGIARADGEVHMDLQAPQGLTPQRAPQGIRGREGRAPSAARDPQENAQIIHVKTSGLVYVKSLGVAATPQDVEFRYAGVEAHARGAEFDEGQSVVHLLADVRLDGELHGSDVHLRAARADLDRSNNLASMAQPVVTQEGKRLSANNGVLHLRKDGSVESLAADGAVTVSAGTRSMRGARLELALNARTQPVHGVLTGGVMMEDTSVDRPMHGAADSVEASFDAGGQPEVVTANSGKGGAANLGMTVFGPGHVALPRALSGDRLVVTLAGAEDDPGRREIREVHAVGHGVLRGESLTPAAGSKAAVRKSTLLAADDLRAGFVDGPKGELLVQHVNGAGHARLEQAGSDGARQASAADAVEIGFAAGKNAGEMTVSSAVETGQVVIRTETPGKNGAAGTVSNGAADRAQFDAATNRMLLAGGAQFRQNGAAVMAGAIAMDQATGDAQASGAVTATLANADGSESHVMSDRARFLKTGQMAEFYGDARPARLWHEASQVQAAVITMDGAAKTLSARPAGKGTVSGVFVSAEPAHGKKAGEAARVLRVTSAKMDYSDKTREAVFTGGVTMKAAEGDVRSQRAVVIFAAKPAGASAGKGSALAGADPSAGSVDHAVALGDVRIQEPGRMGTGEQLTYTAATDQFVLTGTPEKLPRVVDEQQGNVVGTTLVFGASDSTIVVAGAEGAGKRGRVRTETTVVP